MITKQKADNNLQPNAQTPATLLSLNWHTKRSIAAWKTDYNIYRQSMAFSSN